VYLKYAGLVPGNAFYGVAKNIGVIYAQTGDPTHNWMTGGNTHFTRITNNKQ